ncbi:MAG: DUF177 domain-containing protein [FCB group bacterium]|nr:DUF177 domain-containing protein [FCB group bacterium]
MLDLQAINEFPARITLEGESSGLEIEEGGVSQAGTASVELNIVLSDNIYYCIGEAACEVKIECSRCLESYSLNLRGALDFTVREAAENASSDEELLDGELIKPSGAGQVDISDHVHEALVLELPLKPLCVKDCRGICPHCGVNRNEEDCDCRTESEDPRWDGLRDLQQ